MKENTEVIKFGTKKGREAVKSVKRFALYISAYVCLGRSSCVGMWKDFCAVTPQFNQYNRDARCFALKH